MRAGSCWHLCAMPGGWNITSVIQADWCFRRGVWNADPGMKPGAALQGSSLKSTLLSYFGALLDYYHHRIVRASETTNNLFSAGHRMCLWTSVSGNANVLHANLSPLFVFLQTWFQSEELITDLKTSPWAVMSLRRKWLIKISNQNILLKTTSLATKAINTMHWSYC